jgi:hypothetical protein
MTEDSHDMSAEAVVARAIARRGEVRATRMTSKLMWMKIVGARQRSSTAPEYPTVAEAGLRGD